MKPVDRKCKSTHCKEATFSTLGKGEREAPRRDWKERDDASDGQYFTLEADPGDREEGEGEDKEERQRGGQRYGQDTKRVYLGKP